MGSLEDIVTAAKSLIEMRQCATLLEEELVAAIEAHCNAGVLMLDLAKSLGVSAQYLSDIRHGRRRVSDAVAARLARLH